MGKESIRSADEADGFSNEPDTSEVLGTILAAQARGRLPLEQRIQAEMSGGAMLSTPDNVRMRRFLTRSSR